MMMMYDDDDDNDDDNDDSDDDGDDDVPNFFDSKVIDSIPSFSDCIVLTRA